jgi:beta-glucosidase
VQTYSRHRVGPDRDLPPEEGVEVLPMGYEFYPESLAATIRRAWEVTEHVPVIVTENGIGTDDDDQRIRYVATALEGVLDCIDEGIDVRGYTYWSLLDNFEWAFGYGPRFGIIDVDRATQRRTVKPSGEWLGQIARANRFPLPT